MRGGRDRNTCKKTMVLRRNGKGVRPLFAPERKSQGGLAIEQVLQNGEAHVEGDRLQQANALAVDREGSLRTGRKKAKGTQRGVFGP